MCNFEDGIGAATAATVASAELDGQYKRLRRVVAKLAHKAQWHNKRTIPIYASAVVSPASDGKSCREMPLTEWWEKCRRVRKEGVIAFKELRHSLCLVQFHPISYQKLQ